MSKKKALGRGLNALLSDSNTEDRLEIDTPQKPRSQPLRQLPAAHAGNSIGHNRG
jgi:hypothetical protein